MGIKQVVKLLTFANEYLQAFEKRFNGLRNDIDILQFRKHTCERRLYQLNNQIASTTKLLNSFHMSCEREREIGNLQRKGQE